jgi:hypothetical protein
MFQFKQYLFHEIQHTIIQIYNVQWDSETSYQTCVNLSPQLDIDNIVNVL